MGFRVGGSGMRVWGLAFGLQGFMGFRVWGSGFRNCGSGVYGAQCLGLIGNSGLGV